ncbi:Vesicle trafficking between the ER and Golgi [Cladochytrium tenue]|nr:Vesicle trafficking between the ER and Golgi [Cladochytrium tenue]
MAAIISMLQLNNRDAASQLMEQDNDGDDGVIVNPSLTEPIWKVLIYDQAGQEIISPLLKVNELRENGITVHMHLNSERLPIPDVPAIYFIQPTIETLKRIGEDLSRKLYDTYYLNFTYTIPRAMLEELAAIAISSNGSNQIAQVYDQYMSFTCLENRLFTFSMSDSYRILNDPTSTDSAIDALTDKIVNSLFSVLATLGVVPIIKSPRRSAAANIASKLDQRLRNHLIDARNNLFSEANASGTRPVLVLLDRSFDISSMLLHSWTYASLVHDVLDMRVNRVVVNLDESGKKTKKVYDVDVSDFFWARNSGNPFPQVAEDVSAEINKYKKEVEEITRTSGVSSLEELDPTANAKHLKNAMSVLPQLTERKRTLDMHMNIATSLFKEVGDRQLDSFITVEEAITKQNKASLLDIFKDEKKSAQDKLRLFLIYYLSVDEIPKDDMAQYETSLLEAGVSVTSLAHVKSIRSYSKIVSATTSSSNQNASSDIFQSITSNISKFAESSRVGGGIENLLSGVTNLIPSRRDLPCTKVVEAIMEGASNAETEDMITLDPRLGKNSTPKATKGRTTFQEAIVFVVGGGNYLEFQNLQEYAQQQA